MEKQQINPSNLLAIKDYARFMGVERQTVYNWIKSGKVKRVEFIGKPFIDKSSYKPD